MRVEEFEERGVELLGREVQLTTYRLGEIWHCKADTVSPGLALARTIGATREEAENLAIERARDLLSRTRPPRERR
jgi:hypothetical protein